MSNKVKATNRKAWHEYYILEKYEGGIVLYGSEVKAIREGKANIKEAYVRFIDNELFTVAMTSSEAVKLAMQAATKRDKLNHSSEL